MHPYHIFSKGNTHYFSTENMVSTRREGSTSAFRNQIADSLPKYLSEELERVQRRAMRVIFPFKPYQEASLQAGLETLSARRQSLTNKSFSKITEDRNNKLSSEGRTTVSGFSRGNLINTRGNKLTRMTSPPIVLITHYRMTSYFILALPTGYELV